MGRGVMVDSNTEISRAVLSLTASPDEAILGSPCSAVINRRYPQAHCLIPMTTQLRLKIEGRNSFLVIL